VDVGGARMNLSKRSVIVFRVTFTASVVAITWLATIKPDYEVVEEINDKVSHILAFVALSFLLDFSFPGRRFNLREVMVLLGFGLLIECVQYFIPYRTCSILDLGADAIGIALYGGAKLLWRNATFCSRSKIAAEGKVGAAVGAEASSPERRPVDVR
jgi:VanZ family protein